MMKKGCSTSFLNMKISEGFDVWLNFCILTERTITGLIRLYVAHDVKMCLTFVSYRHIAVMSTWTYTVYRTPKWAQPCSQLSYHHATSFSFLQLKTRPASVV